MLKVIGAIVGVLVIVLLGIVAFASTRPSSFVVQRTIAIDAPPEKIYPLIEDFHQWRAWSPYENMDPQMTRTYSGAPKGKGAAYAWVGQKAGSGGMEITEAQPASKIVIDLKFTKPMVASNIAEFTLAPKGEATHVTWAMRGPSPLVAKIMGLFFDMDTLIGKDFETGLAKLKTAAET